MHHVFLPPAALFAAAGFPLLSGSKIDLFDDLACVGSQPSLLAFA
jgi:hypothetical protein